MKWTCLFLCLSAALSLCSAAITRITTEQRLIVMYSYYYATPSLHPDEENLLFFACTGVYFNDQRVQYRFLFAADDPVKAEAGFQSTPLYDALPPEMFTATNVHIMWLPNGFYDLCTYKRAITEPWFLRLPTSISLFFFLNATVRGPFLPFYAQQIPWWEPFLSLLADTTSMVGPYLNCEVAPHIQTLAFLLDQEGLEVAKKTWFCPSSEVRHNEAARARWIAKTEVGLSRNLVAAGRSFSALLASHVGVDGARLKSDESCNLRNPTFYHNYFGTYPNPYEVIFFKCGGDISRAHAMPDHSVSSLQLYTEAVAKTWTHSVARERFLSHRGLTLAPCPSPVPEKNAFCMDSIWVIRGDWHITDHAIVRSKVRVLGSLKLQDKATLTISGDLDSPVIAVDGSIVLHGQLHIALHRVGRIGATVLLRSQQGVSLRGLIRVEGAEPFDTVTKVECNGLCLVLHTAEGTHSSYLAVLVPSAALLGGVLLYWRKRRTRERRQGVKLIVDI